jgi:hypothetical protein
MTNKREKKINNSEYWYIILPICILLLLGYFVYVMFHMSSIQIIDSKKATEVFKKLVYHSRNGR